ncbi:cache domain-containing sensor histidine kinase [Paenibacillus humicola]|uniref:cache domain-containing sensor histidine kinase n=1 Tax=Paenibacillus humicola TaxID=3110540 RepID=UPI00237A781F|nr:sensor histidine kinase [Paenibacillus humicola]
MRWNYRGWRSVGLMQKALVIFLLFVILPTIGVGVLVQYWFNEVLRDQFIGSTKRGLDTVINQLEEETALVEDIADYLILSPDMRNFLRTSPPLGRNEAEIRKQNIAGFLTFQLMSKDYIKSISITGFNGSSIEMGEPFNGDESAWLHRADNRKGGIVWSAAYTLDSDWGGSERLISLFRVLNSYSETTKPLGRLVIRLDESSIENLLKSGVFKEKSFLYVLDENGETILQPEHLPGGFRPDGKLLRKLRTEGGSASTLTIGKARYLTFYRTMEKTDWQIVAMVPESIVNEETRGLKVLTAVILASILALAVIALIRFHYTIIRPILRLKRETNRVKLGDFSARVPIESNDEIAELNRKFNDMVFTIQELVEHKYKLELRERESELKLLQNQMDPHFLYNTLDMIRWTARLEKASRSSQLIEMLSRFFRSSLNNGRYRTTILEELEWVRSYLYLQQRRLGSKLSYSLFTDADVAGAITLKASIQPLVENFLKHGWDRSKPVNTIAVRCYAAEQGEIWIDVRDNGRGLSTADAESVRASLRRSSDGIVGAMGNIHERLSIFFGEGYGLEVVQSSGDGAWIRLRIPHTQEGD